MTPEQMREREIIQSVVARLRARVMALVCGAVGGSGLLVATVWLVIRGGENVGEHLSLLNHYFPGYSVDWGGSLVGFFYGAMLGGAVGYAMAWVYNRIADRRHPA